MPRTAPVQKLNEPREMKQRMHAALLWAPAGTGVPLKKSTVEVEAGGDPISKMRDFEGGSAPRRRRALPPPDEQRSVAESQTERNEPSADNLGKDLVFRVPISNSGWILDHHWGARIRQISVSFGVFGR